jgi:hypothetical protein
MGLVVFHKYFGCIFHLRLRIVAVAVGLYYKLYVYGSGQCRLVNAVKSIDVDRFGPADLSACEAPDNVEQLRIIFFT